MHILVMNSICSPQTLDERLSVTTFVSNTAFNLKEYISVSISKTVIL